jgi:hypothetical protein
VAEKENRKDGMGWETLEQWQESVETAGGGDEPEGEEGGNKIFESEDSEDEGEEEKGGYKKLESKDSEDEGEGGKGGDEKSESEDSEDEGGGEKRGNENSNSKESLKIGARGGGRDTQEKGYGDGRVMRKDERRHRSRADEAKEMAKGNGRRPKPDLAV